MTALGTWLWDIDPVLLRLGPLEFRYYGILFAAALMSGYGILRWQYEQDGEDPENAVRLTYALIAGVILGARFGHVFFYEADKYLANPVEIIKFWKGGLASHGATIGIFTVLLVYVYLVRKIPFRVMADRLALTIPLATTCVRLGNFFNSEIVGRVTEVPWAVVMPRHDMAPRHPSQLYEAAMGVVLFAILYAVNRYYVKRGVERPLGLMSSALLAGYFSMRFGVEFFKAYQVSGMEGPLTMGQYLSLPFATVGYVGLWASLRGPWAQDRASKYLVTSAKKVATPEEGGGEGAPRAKGKGASHGAGKRKQRSRK